MKNYIDTLNKLKLLNVIKQQKFYKMFNLKTITTKITKTVIKRNKNYIGIHKTKIEIIQMKMENIQMK